MSFRHLTVICSILICVYAKSFTLVIDTTYSMQNEINFIRSQIEPLVRSIGNTMSIENYMLVPFNNPDIDSIQTFTKADLFVNSVRSLTITFGNDDPENTLSVLEKALQESRPESDVFLFTDACAKDDEAKFNAIERLCGITRSKVIIFMSGTCPNAERNKVGNIETYNNVSKVCFGNVFQLDMNKFGQAFTFIKEVVRDGYNDVDTYESFSGYREVPVDGLTRSLIVAVVGESAVVKLSDDGGQSPHTETLIDSGHSLVKRIVGPHRGLYTAAVRCRGETTVTVYSRTEFPFNIGFSPMNPRTIQETTSSPLPGRESFILVSVPDTYEYKLSTLTIHFLNKDIHKTLDLSESNENARVYISKAYFEAGSIFRMTVNGMDSASSEPVHITSRAMESQREVSNVPRSAAVIENIIPESSLTDYKKNAIVACKVTGFPKPTIWWEDDEGQNIPAEDSLLMYPATYISYVTIPNLMENRTISCKSRTSSGSDSRTTQLFVYRPYVFEMIRKPKDISIEYEAEGRLYCEVNSYPEAKIRWYHNNEDIEFTTNETYDDFNRSSELEYFLEDNALVIKNMSSKYVGTYACDVRNDAHAVAFEVRVDISGLEPPELQTSETQLTSRIGEGVKIQCRISKGRPAPELTWKYKPVDGYEFSDLPEDIEVAEESLMISEVTSKHKGAYKCEASNEQGTDAREVELRVIYAPKIENAETTTREVVLNNLVTIQCAVDAEPKATVKWERNDGTYFPDDKHVLDGNSLKFTASYNDSGSYRCVAENEAGSAEKTTIVKVLVRPLITQPSETITVRAGGPLKLSCNVEEANPPPTITWQFKGHPKWINLSEERSTFTSEYIIPRVTRADAGTYICYVENSAGWDDIVVNVNVK